MAPLLPPRAETQPLVIIMRSIREFSGWQWAGGVQMGPFPPRAETQPLMLVLLVHAGHWLETNA